MEIVVNGERISAEAFQQEVARVLRERPTLAREEVEARARENLIARQILRQNALASGIAVSNEDIDREYRNLVAVYGGEAQFYAALGGSKRQHEKRVRRDLQERIRTERFMEALTADVPAPSEDAVEDYRRQHAREFVRPAVVRASQIVRGAGGPGGREAYRELVAARQRLLEGADFAEVARACTGDDPVGGDLGRISPGRMPAAVDAALFSMRAGEVSPIILSELGLHLLKVWEAEAERPMDDEEAVAEARARLLAEARERRLAEWMLAKRSRAVVELRP